jgi:small subunit ribosomal protein S8
MMTDPIADMFTRIRNALRAGKPTVRIPGSRLKEAVLGVLRDEGYIIGFRAEREGAHPALDIELKYHEGSPVIRDLQRVSRPGLRIYKSPEDVKPVLGGLGIAILSTPKGVMTDRTARRERVGGEVMGTVS